MSSAQSSQALLSGQAVELVASDICRKTPFEGISSVAPLMDSLASSQEGSIQERARMIFSLDDASQVHARSYIERFLSIGLDQTSSCRALWTTARGHWITVLESYSDILSTLAGDEEAMRDTELVAQLAVRTMRAACLRAKWDAFNACAMDGAVWACLNRAYALALRCGVDGVLVSLRDDRAAGTSAEREYLRAIALHSIGLEQLDPVRVEAATSLVHYVLPSLELSAVQDFGCSYWVDVAKALPPARLLSTPEGLVLPRFFSGVPASQALRGLLELSASGEREPGFPKQMDDPALMTSVLSRMIRLWANELPLRRHRRMPMAGQVVVAEGMSSVLGKLKGEGEVSAVWKMQDASLLGMGLMLPVLDAPRLRAGGVIGFRPSDGDHWCVGVVRRLRRLGGVLPHGQVEVGVELLARSPELVSADDGERAVSALLLDPLQKDAMVRLLVPNPGPCPDRQLHIVCGEQTFKLQAADTLEYGVDFVLRNYRLVP